MESKKMLVGLVLIAAFALPALASFVEKDVITPEAIQLIKSSLRKTSLSNTMLEEGVLDALIASKTIISKTVLEEALLKNANNINGRLGGVPCGESCVYIPCFTGIINCSCRDKVCYNNALVN